MRNKAVLRVLFRCLLFPLLGAFCLSAQADLAVIANTKVGVDSVSREELINIYMGRLRRFSSGETAQPLDLPASSPEKALFYRLLVNKDLSDIDAYWARLVFSGRTSPPDIAKDAGDVIERVATNPGAIGYVDVKDIVERLAKDKRIKIIFSLPAETRQ